jgi:hypothetical protein
MKRRWAVALLLFSAAVLAAQIPDLPAPVIFLPPTPQTQDAGAPAATGLNAHVEAVIHPKAERDGHAQERQKAGKSSALTTDAELAESARLCKRVGELLHQLEDRKRSQARHVEPVKPSTPTPAEILIGVVTQFHGGQYESALASLRRLDIAVLGRGDKALAQYLTAGCLRNLGKLDEAATLYQQVGTAGNADDALLDGAAAQLLAVTARRDMERQLAELRTQIAKP